MKLMHGKLSPFVRKVMMFVIAKGLEEQVEVVAAAVGQGKINAELLALNPTGKIPTLITDDGTSIYDSLVICDYLDGLAATPRALPDNATERTRALTLNAAADGLVVAGVLAGLERGKAAERQWPEFEAAQWAKVNQCLAVLARDCPGRTSFDIGTAGALCALGWADARAAHLGWRTQYPALAAWVDGFQNRPEVARTAPPAA